MITNGISDSGGAIDSGGFLTMARCTVAGNVAHTQGGAINVRTASTGGYLHLQNCTITGNSAPFGGAIYADFFAAIVMHNCTISSNTTTNQGSIHSNGPLVLGGTILQNLPSNFIASGSVQSDGYNIFSNGGDGISTATGDQTFTDPKLDPLGLQLNGGTVPTIALTSGSPAIDKGFSFGLHTDERGLVRPHDLPGYANASGGDGVISARMRHTILCNRVRL
jgi:predicted outer membrane repeat protein